MASAWLAAAAILLATLLVGLASVWRRQGGPEALLAALLFSTAGVALSLVLGVALDEPRASDVALVLALLAAVLGVTFVLRGWSVDGPGEGRS